MSLRNEINLHTEKAWILALTEECLNRTLSPLVQMVDWYNNQILTKSIKSRKIDLSFGAKTLIPTNGLLATQKLILIGLGQSQTLGQREAARFLNEAVKTIDGLGISDPWLIFEPQTPKEFVDEIKKSRTSMNHLARATISID